MDATTERQGHRVVSGGEHSVRFYEEDPELVAAVGPYLWSGLCAGEAAVVIATDAHAGEFTEWLRRASLDVRAAEREGRLRVLGAAETLASLMSGERIDPVRFDRLIGGELRELAGTGRSLRAYGEMVGLLWDEGNVTAAIELETLWNGLVAELSLTLLCGYRSDPAAGSEDERARATVCSLHSAVQHPPAGAEPSLLAAEFDRDVLSPGQARHLLEEALRAESRDETTIFEAALVVTELASNAVRHARTGFRVSARRLPTGLRIEVRDFSPADGSDPRAALTPRPPHGLALVAATCPRWGSEPTADGKLVWAELALPRG